eukprot:scaffold14371_cov115-Isochrysis_galbana.AAC.1
MPRSDAAIDGPCSPAQLTQRSHSMSTNSHGSGSSIVVPTCGSPPPPPSRLRGGWWVGTMTRSRIRASATPRAPLLALTSPPTTLLEKETVAPQASASAWRASIRA